MVIVVRVILQDDIDKDEALGLGEWLKDHLYNENDELGLGQIKDITYEIEEIKDNEETNITRESKG